MDKFLELFGVDTLLGYFLNIFKISDDTLIISSMKHASSTLSRYDDLVMYSYLPNSVKLENSFHIYYDWKNKKFNIKERILMDLDPKRDELIYKHRLLEAQEMLESALSDKNSNIKIIFLYRDVFNYFVSALRQDWIKINPDISMLSKDEQLYFSNHISERVAHPGEKFFNHKIIETDFDNEKLHKKFIKQQYIRWINSDNFPNTVHYQPELYWLYVLFYNTSVNKNNISTFNIDERNINDILKTEKDVSRNITPSRLEELSEIVLRELIIETRNKKSIEYTIWKKVIRNINSNVMAFFYLDNIQKWKDF